MGQIYDFHLRAHQKPDANTPRTNAQQWLRHLLAYVVGVVTMGFFTLLVDNVPQMLPAWGPMAAWGFVLVVDFVISFSYTLSPRKQRG